jgi:hypothetical protein
MSVLPSINCTEPAACGLTIAVNVSMLTAATAKESGGVTASAVTVAAFGVSEVTPPTSGAAFATPPRSNADPAAMASRILDASRAKDLPLPTMFVTLAQEWRRIPGYLGGATLAPVGEHDWSSSRREDCDKPHKGQLLSAPYARGR